MHVFHATISARDLNEGVAVSQIIEFTPASGQTDRAIFCSVFGMRRKE